MQLFKAQDDRADEFHASLIEKMDRFEKDVRDSLQRLELQTGKSEGRLTKLEGWQSMVIGFCACMSVFIVPIILAFVISYIRVVHG